MMKKKCLVPGILLCIMISGCSKYLDVTPNDALSIPTSLGDLAAMMENTGQLNNIMPFHHNISTDETELSLAQWQSLGETTNSAYVWAKDIVYTLNTHTEWYFPYRGILYTNLVLEGLEAIEKNAGNQIEYDNLKGSALFYRSFYLYSLQEMYGQPYKPSSASSDLSIPLRLSSDFDAKTTRATVDEVFTIIVNDLKEAGMLIIQSFEQKNLNRPSKAAVYAMLSRVYLTMQRYPESAASADSCLSYYNSLVDYNTVNATANLPFASYANSNAEVIFQAGMTSFSFPTRPPVEILLFNSYSANDMRKQVLYRIAPGTVIPEFKGSYTGLFSGFAGLATNEVFLNRAEANARAGNTDKAMEDLNTLLDKRWRTNQFVPLTAVDADSALRIILEERKKELVLRGTRWTDLRRLNQDPRFAKVLTRNLGGVIYELLPQSARYTFPIPDEVIRFTGISNNIR